MIATKRQYEPHWFTEHPRGRKIFADAATMGADLGRYKAHVQERDAAGKPLFFRVNGVEIFRATKRPNPKTGELDDFGESWLQDAVNNHRNMAAGGYLPPAHFGHHSNSQQQEPPRIGELANMEMRTVDGVPTLFADIVNIPPDMFGLIRQRRVPYRSVEIGNPKVPAITSVALMGSTVPFHKFRLLHVDLEGDDNAGQFWAGDANRVCFADVLPDQSNRQRLVVVDRFRDLDYRAMDDPTSQARKFCRMRGQSFESPDGAMDEPDDDLSDDDYAALLDMLSGSGELDDMDGMGDMDGADSLDADELGELDGEGMDVGALTDAINGLSAKMDTLINLQGQGGVGTPGVGSDQPPMMSAEPKKNPQTFAETKPSAPSNGNGNGRHVANGDTVSRAEFVALATQFKELSAENEKLRQQFGESARVNAEARINDWLDEGRDFVENKMRLAGGDYARMASGYAAYFDEWSGARLGSCKTIKDVENNLNPMVCFQEYCEKFNLDHSGVNFADDGNPDIPPVDNRGHAAQPNTNSNRPAKITDSDVREYLEEFPEHQHHFSDDPDGFKRELQDAAKIFAELPPERQAAARDWKNQAATMIDMAVSSAKKWSRK